MAQWLKTLGILAEDPGSTPMTSMDTRCAEALMHTKQIKILQLEKKELEREQLKALVTPAQDPGLVPTMHVASHNQFKRT